ncbi:MAG TPA: geranylgeranylglyceryl/heptaprenylglyceryl phosphate synthase [Saprospiraceae bacterium]|nr:geranylgeranylglyceryl/heptaprenylglyceryl phosphate synthase [Saprospiraceae bacterium]HOJ89936.1 geranylgeranylglyceryl/heptaprenylglyceryl phosphate synthase [Saprospiraceae bacterium]HUN15520.1 geranylgeranylglyceryl/heptaprenylglyceryl phosphate synthase [Saprospiraceae bacterium]
MDHIYKGLLNKKAKGIKSFAILIDPDHQKLKNLEVLIDQANKYSVDYFFIGGSLVLQDRVEETIKLIRENSEIPIVLFPGNGFQVSIQADAILFLSLISGRNADFLIGRQVETAPKLHASKLEVISTGYMLIDGKASNTAAYMSHTQAIPAEKSEIAQATALAGEYLGMKLIFMDAGSGALKTVSEDMIHRVNKSVQIPLLIGGGIRDAEKAYDILKAGADVIVVGNALEEDPFLVRSISAAVKEFSKVDMKRTP